MKTAKEIVENDGLTEHDQCEGYILKVQDIIDYMEQYAELYHESEVKKLNLHRVIKSVCSLCKKEIEVNRESNIFCDECWKTL